MVTIDKSAEFLEVIESHKGILFKVANSYCKSDEDRKDLVQEVIIQLWRSFENYNNQFKLSTWIYRIALNVAISFYRKEKSRKNISNPITSEIFNFSDPSIPTEKATNLGILYQIISELNDLDKGLILLYLEEKSYKEISEVIGITETNVATKINRIKNKLKKEFNLKITQ
ncbi:MAG: sigma-70 family RNA polymerase sigma factor [Saprospiraceae bacterium]|nr:sigma-70 family RNA polymerase sigma factor [Saprospiraceae bacterium]